MEVILVEVGNPVVNLAAYLAVIAMVKHRLDLELAKHIMVMHKVRLEASLIAMVNQPTLVHSR